jgi:hypothetical protein
MAPYRGQKAKPRPLGGDSLLHPQVCAWNGAADAFVAVDVLEAVSPPPRLKTCPECGARFVCGPASGKNACWCDDG